MSCYELISTNGTVPHWEASKSENSMAKLFYNQSPFICAINAPFLARLTIYQRRFVQQTKQEVYCVSHPSISSKLSSHS